MINVPSARLMIVANGERAQAIIQGLSMVLNIGMNLLLIPMLGAVGAAWARVGSTGLFVLLGLGYTFVKLHRWNPIRVVMWPLAAVIVMLLIGSALLRVSEILAVGAGLVGYGLLVWVSGIFPRDERAVLVRAVRQSIRAA
jgi:O-antigen/teichoic acid export membrane protein